MNRRAALLLVAGLIMLAALPAVAVIGAAPTSVAAGATHRAIAALPGAAPSTATPIRHFVMLMQSNHSFDSYFGTYPGADGIPPGTCLPLDTARPDAPGCVRPYKLGTEPPLALDRTAGVQRDQFDLGRMDGFVSAYRSLGRDGRPAMGYFDGADIPYYWNVADEYTLFDRFFSSATVGTRLNSFYWVAGVPTPDASERVPAGGYGDIPTIFDRLQERGIPWKFYVENLDRAATFRNPSPATARIPLQNFARFVDDPALASHIVDLSAYSRDVETGNLPAVSYIVTSGSSENPPGPVLAGETLVRSLVAGLETSPVWDSSAFLWTYSGWGGFYDHVPPPLVDAHGLGFRVPALMVSPFSRRGVVDHTPLDYTAALKFIETNWGLPGLGSRDAASPGLASAFDFSAPPRPPQLLGLERITPPPVDPRTRTVVYLTYGSALVVAAAAAWLPGRLRRRRVERVLEVDR